MLGDGLRQPLDFRVSVDWRAGLAVSLRWQIAYFASELRRPDSLASNDVALTSLTDLMLQTLLLALPHNYSERLTRRSVDVSPGVLRRAEDFMRVNAREPLRMEQVAAAAGCGIRTLNAGYARLRGTTPMTDLRRIRLANARAELAQGADTPIGTIAQRHGFTNAGRFARAYHQQFGELPSDTIRINRSSKQQSGA